MGIEHNSTDLEMVAFTLPLNSLSRIGGICLVGILCLRMKADSMKQCVEPDSTQTVIRTLGTDSECKLTIKEGTRKSRSIESNLLVGT